MTNIQTKAALNGEKIDWDYIAKNVFWHAVYDDKNTYVKKVNINYLDFTEFLYRHGFRRYDFQDESMFVQIIHDRILNPITITDIQDFVFKWLDGLPSGLDQDDILKPSDIISKLLSGISFYFNKQRLYYLRPKQPIKLNECTKKTQYFYYQNGFVEITAAGVIFKTYKNLKGFIWKSQVLNRDFKQGAKTKDKTVYNFCHLVSDKSKPSRFKALRVAIGYYLHQYTEYKLKALVLTDGSSEADEANGRTGKTLFCRLIGHMVSADPQDPTIKSYVEINGKDFDPRDKHKYGKAGPDTKLLILNDLKPYFKLDPIYNDITDFQTVDKKNMQPFNIRAKMILTKNRTLNLQGSSDRDRVLEFEFSDYFGENRTPEQEFGHWFFSSWDVNQWAAYDHFMCECSRMFLANSCKLIEPDQINLSARKLQENTPNGFVDFVEQVWKPVHDEPYDCHEVFRDFLEEEPDHNNNKFKRVHFTNALKMYCNLKPGIQNWDSKLNITRLRKFGEEKLKRHYKIFKTEE